MKARTRSPRVALWLSLAAGLAWILSVGAVWLPVHRDELWNAYVSRHCDHLDSLPPLPDNRIFGWTVIVLVVVAAACALAALALVLRGRHPLQKKTGAVLLVVLALPFSIFIGLGGLEEIQVRDRPGRGTDGSGLPCPFG